MVSVHKHLQLMDIVSLLTGGPFFFWGGEPRSFLIILCIFYIWRP